MRKDTSRLRVSLHNLYGIFAQALLDDFRAFIFIDFISFCSLTSLSLGYERPRRFLRLCHLSTPISISLSGSMALCRMVSMDWKRVESQLLRKSLSPQNIKAKKYTERLNKQSATLRFWISGLPKISAFLICLHANASFSFWDFCVGVSNRISNRWSFFHIYER